MMDLFLFLLALGLLVVLVLPLVNFIRITRVRREMESLSLELTALRHQMKAEVVPKPVDATERVPRAEAVPEGVSVAPPPLPEQRPHPVEPVVVKERMVPVALPEEEKPVSPEPGDVRVRGDWFGRLSIWVGGVALLMAGFYLVKYSLDSGWVTPTVRVSLATVFGLVLCFAGAVMGRLIRSAGNERVGQALCGAGVASLYFAGYAAVHLYALMPVAGGFAAMVATTLLAVVLSLRLGAPIALMGLVGGFLTPYLMGGEVEDTRLLFLYLFFLYAGSQYLCLRRGWLGLGLFALVASYLWSATLILGMLVGDLPVSRPVSLFILGVCGLNMAWIFIRREEDPDGGVLSGLWMAWALVFLGGGVLQLLTLAWLQEFSGVEMGMFAILATGALVLAVLREKTFVWAAWLAGVAVAVAITMNDDPSTLAYYSWAVGLSMMVAFTAHGMTLRSDHPRPWFILTLASASGFLLLSYLNRELIMEAASPFAAWWLVLAVIVAGMILAAAEHFRLRRDQVSSIVGCYNISAWAVIAFGLWSYLPDDYQMHGAVLLLLGVAAYWRIRQLPLATEALYLIGVYWLFYLPLPTLAALDYVLGTRLNPSWLVETPLLSGLVLSVVVLWALPQVGGAALTVAARNAARAMGGFALVLALLAAYRLLTTTLFEPRAYSPQCVSGGLTSLLAVCSALAFAAIRTRGPACLAGGILAGLAAYRILIFHLTGSGAAGDSFFFNALLWQFGIPLAATLVILMIVRSRAWEGPLIVFQVAAMLLAFVWGTFLVRDYYGASRLLGSLSGSAELYTLSVVWLGLAVIFQSIGLWRRSFTLHLGSLLLLLLTVGKVFLVDAANLTGLLRVLSFLVLGLTLLGIGFFYNKVVFSRSDRPS